MPEETVEASHFSPDTQDFLLLLNKHRVRYLIVGGEAVIYYGYLRLTGDIDFFYDHQKENAKNLFRALKEFWSGSIPNVSDPKELEEEGLILQFGRPPNRIDLINRIEGVDFSEAWPFRKTVVITKDGASLPAFYIGLEQLIQNKVKVGRPKDLDDLKFLRRCLDLGKPGLV